MLVLGRFSNLEESNIVNPHMNDQRQLHNTNVTPHSLLYLQSIDACLDILLLIFVYLAVMHNLVLIHTNLKPENISGNCRDWNKVNVDILGESEYRQTG